MIKKSITYTDLIEDFANRNIPIDTPGFYDHPNFMKIEEKNASYLSNYAKFVDYRPREQSYDDYVKSVVPLVAKIFHKKLEKCYSQTKEQTQDTYSSLLNIKVKVIVKVKCKKNAKNCTLTTHHILLCI